MWIGIGVFCCVGLFIVYNCVLWLNEDCDAPSESLLFLTFVVRCESSCVFVGFLSGGLPVKETNKTSPLSIPDSYPSIPRLLGQKLQRHLDSHSQ